jgi:hypothetical protein
MFLGPSPELANSQGNRVKYIGVAAAMWISSVPVVPTSPGGFMSPSRRTGIRVLATILFVVVTFNFPAIAQAPNPVGEWSLQSDAQGQVTNFTLTITREGQALKGKITSETYGPQDLKDLKVENGTVTYTRNLDLGGQTVAMAFKGKIEGDKLTGAYTLMEFEIPVTGTRKAPATK